MQDGGYIATPGTGLCVIEMDTGLRTVPEIEGGPRKQQIGIKPSVVSVGDWCGQCM